MWYTLTTLIPDCIDNKCPVPEICVHKDIKIDRLANRQTNIQTNRQVDRQIYRLARTDRQINKQWIN